MTPETEQAPSGYFRRPRSSAGAVTPVRLSPGDLRSIVRDPGTPVRSDDPVFPAGLAAATRPVPPAAPPAARPAPPAVPRRAPGTAVRRARGGGSIVGAVPYLAVLAGLVVGVYIAWQLGSAGGGRGGVVGGLALLAAAALRLALPARLVGLLGTRKRTTDVLMLALFGGGLLVSGLVLPH